MKKTLLLTITLLLAINFSFGQKNNRHLPESLNSKEIRIIKSSESVNDEIIRIFQDSDLKWKFEYYISDSQGNLSFIKGKNISDSDLWLKIIRTQIENIPDQKEIEYKFKIYKDVELSETASTLSFEKPHLLDKNEDFHIFIQGEKFNHVSYSSPDFYLKMFPEIDELNSVVETLNLVRNEVELWKS